MKHIQVAVSEKIFVLQNMLFFICKDLTTTVSPTAGQTQTTVSPTAGQTQTTVSPTSGQPQTTTVVSCMYN